MPNEDDYRRWKDAVFGSECMIWHDGLDVSAVRSLEGSAREDALRMLRVGVDLEDSHAAEALAAMGETSAAADMRAQLSQSSGADKVRLARAIHAVSPDDLLANELIEVLESDSPDFGDRVSAAIGLRDFEDSPSERALLRAIERDGDYLVRYHAAESLLRRWQVVRSAIAEHPDIFELIRSPRRGVATANERALLREATLRLESLRRRDG